MPGSHPPTVALVQEHGPTDHFAGVPEALAARGVGAEGVLLDGGAPILPAGARVVAVADVRSFFALNALRQARRAGATTALLMDGLVEYRNTFLNPRVGDRFLRPAPVDVVACAGEADRERLAWLGNEAVATGLPRLDAIRPMPLPAGRRVLVATARQPAFGDGERRRLVGALRTVAEAVRAAGAEVVWRLTGGLEREIGVEADTGPLGASLAGCGAVIAAPTTLLIEAMRAGRPAALLFPFDAPCWPLAAWSIGACATAADAARVVESLLAPTPSEWGAQQNALERMHQERRPAAEALADLLVELIAHPRRNPVAGALLDPTRLPAPVPRVSRRPRVLSLVRCDSSPVGGVTVWSRRLARAFAGGGRRYDVRTLLIATQPDSIPPAPVTDGGLTHACVIDPTGDQFHALRSVREAIDRLDPDIVLPNYSDLCYAAAAQRGAVGTRTIAIAHTDHEWYRNLIGTYDAWDGAVGVSEACMAWLRPLRRGRPLSKIVYGVPVSSEPRRVEADGPLRLAYVGRMVEVQKRIGDLLGVIDGLEARGVRYELHMIGDGEDFARWRSRLRERVLRHGSVVIHGRREPEWVESFLRTIDVSVLVSEYEGTSITMLEAMGAGVAPAVTRVASGVDEWVRDGENGVVVPVGEPDLMAERLGALAADRGAIARMGEAAWRTVRSAISLDAMADAYGALFDEVMARPVVRRPTDLGVRLIENYTWHRDWAERPEEAMAWIAGALREAGYRRIAVGAPAPGCDAVILRASDTPETEAVARRCREEGLGVAVWPHLQESTVADRLHVAAEEAIRGGARRLAIYGAGRHTRRGVGVFSRGLPIVGIIDDNPPARGAAFGVPVVTPARALVELKPDVVILSSDAWEDRLWERSAALRSAGVRVVRLYGGEGAGRQAAA